MNALYVFKWQDSFYNNIRSRTRSDPLAETFGFPVLTEVADNDGRIFAIAFLDSPVSLVIIASLFSFFDISQYFQNENKRRNQMIKQIKYVYWFS